MRIRKSRCLESGVKDCANGPGVFPMPIAQPRGCKKTIRVGGHMSCRKQRVLRTEASVGSKMGDLVGEDFLYVVAHRKKPCREGLAKFGVHFARVLKDRTRDKVDVFEAEGGNGAVTGPSEKG